MSSFLKKLSIFLIIFAISIIAILTIVDWLGWSDSEYKRFASGTKSSLIIGTSRAAQGIVPEIINEHFESSIYSLPIYNFSFNISASPYGETYYNSIKRKLNESHVSTPLYILAVDPFALAEEKEQDKHQYRELKRSLAHIRHYYRPQYGYLIRYCRPDAWHKNKPSILHDDGWLEINRIDMDSVSVNERIKLKMLEYNEYKLSKSEYRISWLIKTISLLRSQGDVFICRIPVSDEMREWEDKNWSSFDADINKIAKDYNVDYIPFTNWTGSLITTDGNHLYKDDARTFTEALCDSIEIKMAYGK